MWEKASPAKKTHPLKPRPHCRLCPHRRRMPCFQLAHYAVLLLRAVIAASSCRHHDGSFFGVPRHNFFCDGVCARWVIFLEYMKVLFRIFGEEWPNGQARVEPNFQPQRFPTESILTARQFRQQRVE